MILDYAVVFGRVTSRVGCVRGYGIQSALVGVLQHLSIKVEGMNLLHGK